MKNYLMIFLMIAAIKTNAQVAPPEWSKNLSIYEVNIRQYTPEGTFDAFTKHIPRLKELGVGILWIMPVQPIGEKNRKGTLGSYYSISNYTETNPEYGSLKDFKNLVDEAHKNGMYVILDWVGNHTAWDHEWIKKYPEYYTHDKDKKIVSPVADWTDVADLNYSNTEMRTAMKNAMEFWLTETHLDGFRCDVAMMIPDDFWQDAFAEFRKIKPDIFLLSEAEGPQFINDGFNMTYAWERHAAMNKIAQGKKKPVFLDSLVRSDLNKYPGGSYFMNFTSNHDENSWNGTEFERMGDAAKAMAVISATLPGMLLIYSGQEVALNKRLSFFEKDTINWTDDKNFTQFYTELIKLKTVNPALWNGSYGGSYKMIDTENELVYAFVREAGPNKVIVMVNCSGIPQDISVTGQVGKYRNGFTGKKVKLGNVFKLQMRPWSYVVYVTH